MMILLFIGPAFLILYFGGIYYNDYVKDIPIAILDEDGSSMSNLVGNYFLTNERFDIINYPSTRQELQNLIDDGEVQMGIYIPDGFESKVSTYQSSQILAITDGTNIVIANNAIAQATLITQSISAGIEMKLIEGKGVSPQIAENMALVYNVTERILFDPKMTYMNYLIVCFLAVFTQQLMLSSMGSVFIRHSEDISSGNVTQKVLAVMSSCFVCILPSTALSMLILIKLFHVPIVGNIWTAIALTVVFMFAITGPSLLIASMAKVRIKYSQFSFMLSLPTFVSSGCVWPVDQMPKLLEIIIRACWPLINYAKVVQEVLIKGTDFNTVIPNILQLGLFSIVWLPIGIICYKNTFSKNNSSTKMVEITS
jgi:ABC-2 type transport system permease protein